VRADIAKHVSDIADKYLIPGETQDMALMFVPSESIYVELYDGFDDVFQRAYRAKVIIVSPSLLMLAIQVIQQIRKDAKMREAADKILVEVGHLITDVQRLRDRVENLDKHFGQANADIKQIVISRIKSSTAATGFKASNSTMSRRRAPRSFRRRSGTSWKPANSAMTVPPGRTRSRHGSTAWPSTSSRAC
jgi:DNA recombination protein RmuC